MNRAFVREENKRMGPLSAEALSVLSRCTTSEFTCPGPCSRHQNVFSIADRAGMHELVSRIYAVWMKNVNNTSRIALTVFGQDVVLGIEQQPM